MQRTLPLSAGARIALLALLIPALATSGAVASAEPGGPPENGASRGEPTMLSLEVALELARGSHPDLPVLAGTLAALRADSTFARTRSFNPVIDLQQSRGGEGLGSGSESTLDLSISQELELFGKRAARQRFADSRARTGGARREARLQEIESGVRASFERARILQDRVERLGLLLELDRQVVAATRARVRDGSMTPLTGRLGELELLRSASVRQEAERDHRQAVAGLSLAIGRLLPPSVRLVGSIEPESLGVGVDSVLAVARRSRRGGEVFRLQIVEADAELQTALRAGRPDLTLGLGYTRERRTLAREDFRGDPAILGGISGASSTDQLWTVRLSSPLPLWQRNQADRARAAAGIARSRAELDRYGFETEVEVRAAVLRFDDALRRLRPYRDRSERVWSDLSLLRDAYMDGRIPVDSYLTQKGRIVDAVLGELDAAAEYWDARGALETTVGLDLSDLNAGAGR